jgi:hypothetical protein
MDNIYWDTTIRQIDYACSAALYEYFVNLLTNEKLIDNNGKAPAIDYFDLEDNQEVVEAVAVKDGDMEYELVMVLDTENSEVIGTSFIAAFTCYKNSGDTPMILARKNHGEYAGFITNMDETMAKKVVTYLCKRYIITSLFIKNSHTHNI